MGHDYLPHTTGTNENILIFNILSGLQEDFNDHMAGKVTLLKFCFTHMESVINSLAQTL